MVATCCINLGQFAFQILVGGDIVNQPKFSSFLELSIFRSCQNELNLKLQQTP